MQRKHFLRAALAALGLASVMAPGSASAQAYPNRPVKIIVPFATGGPADVYARFIAQRLSDSLGQSFVVDNKPGGGSVIGTDLAAKSPADGYTLLMMSNTHTVNETLIPTKPFQLMRDFVGVAPVNYSDLVLVAHPSVAAGNLRELIAQAKANPGKMNYASSGPGTPYHMAGELFKSMAGIDVVHVPYKGVPEALTDTLANRVQFFMAPLSSALSLVKEGRLRPLAVSTAKRASAVPEVPTVAEAAIPGFEFDSWGGLLAPAKTPRPVILRLNAEVAAALALPDIQARMRALGAEPETSTPEAFDAFVARQVALIAGLAARAGLAPGR